MILYVVSIRGYKVQKSARFVEQVAQAPSFGSRGRSPS